MSITTRTLWEKTLVTRKAWWRHDGNKNRPFAQLASGLISEQYINMSGIISRPSILFPAAETLAEQLNQHLSADIALDNVVMVGQMKGSVTIASRIAEAIDSEFIWLNKSDDSPDKDMIVDPRFDISEYRDRTFVMVEDVLSTGSTSRKSQRTLRNAGFKVADLILTVVNRSELRKIAENTILSCIDINMLTWKEGENPYTSDGKEIVPPVRPKGPDGHLLWKVM